MRIWSRTKLVATVVAAMCVGAATTSWAASATAPARPSGPTAPLVAVTPTVNPETLFVPITPCRIVDTRNAVGALVNGSVRSYYVSGTTGFLPQGGTNGGCGIPASATGITAVMAAVTPQHGGFFRAWAYGTPMPFSSIFNYAGGLTLSSGQTLPITPNGGPALSVQNAAGPTQLVIDVTGYYIPQIEGYIGGDGSIQVGTARIVSVSHAATGFYYVTLDRPVRSCSITATAYNIFRYASVGYSSSSTPNVVSIYVWYLNGTTATPEDYPFHIHVSC